MNSLVQVSTKPALIKMEKKTLNAINQALKLSQDSLDYDLREDAIWKSIFAADRAGNTRGSLEKRIKEAEGVSIKAKMKRTTAEAEITRATQWLLRLENHNKKQQEIATSLLGHEDKDTSVDLQPETAADLLQAEDEGRSMNSRQEMMDTGDDQEIAAGLLQAEDEDTRKNSQQEMMDTGDDILELEEDMASVYEDMDSQQEMMDTSDDVLESEEDMANEFEDIDSNLGDVQEPEFDTMDPNYQTFLEMPRCIYEDLTDAQMRDDIVEEDIEEEIFRLNLTLRSKISVKRHRTPGYALSAYIKERHDIAISFIKKGTQLGIDIVKTIKIYRGSVKALRAAAKAQVSSKGVKVNKEKLWTWLKEYVLRQESRRWSLAYI